MIGKIILFSIITILNNAYSLNHNEIKTIFQASYVDHFDSKTNAWNE